MQLTDAVQFLSGFHINAERLITPEDNHNPVFPARINAFMNR